MRRRNWLATAIAAVGAVMPAAFAQKAGAPKPKDVNALAEEHVKDLLLLMDTDKNGKISKQEFMRFMEAEFERLDKDKSGELDPHELLQSRFQIAHFADVGK